ncbi:MAG TPA: serine hydrolase domain-containing protein [Acidimicrobiales bacterium]|nr:serine hydrolase domain-containing protein [Acidimicrobiales bacterium]
MESWPVDHAAAVALGPGGEVTAAVGDLDRPFALASVTKPLFATAVLVAVEEESLGLDDPAGPEGSTVRHLLAHASGLGLDGLELARPGRRRIYSNAGYDVLGATLEAGTGLAPATYLAEAVLGPLGMATTALEGSPAHAATGTAADLARLVAELMAPRLLAPSTVATATAVAFPGLDGLVPGYGKQRPNDWGLGVEIKGTKDPHWTAPGGSPRTYGHFGRSGTFLWVDPDAGRALVVLTDRDFEAWAKPLWPALGTAVLAAPS